MDIKSASYNKNFVCMVDYLNNFDLKSNGVSFHWWSSEPTSMHYHNFYEFFIIMQGSVIHEINGEVHKLPKYTLHLIRPEDCHRIIPADSKSCIHMNLCAVEEKFKAVCSALNINPDELTSGKNAKALLTVDEVEFFTKQAERISMLSHNNEKGSDVIMCEMLSQAIAILYKSKIFSQLKYPLWFTEVLEKIHSPEFLSCNAADVYKLGGFSPPVMISYFKKYTGKTVSEYIREVKINYACRSLKDSDISILELSNILGYASLSHFNRVFKESVGITPAAYRKK